MKAPQNRLASAPSAAGVAARPTLRPTLRSVGIQEIVVVDSNPDRYGELVQAAQAGEAGLHFCVDGRSAVRLARRFRADIWLVAADLPDMSGYDLLEMLSPLVLQGSVDPLRSGHPISLDRIGHGMRSGIFMVADDYSIEAEQRALASGVSGYLIRPVTIDIIRAVRAPAVPEGAPAAADA
jgi:PleD family two-component response regulator